MTILSKIEWASKNGVIFFVVKDKKIQVLIYEWESEVHTICREKKYEEKHTDLGKKIQRKIRLKMAFLEKYTLPPYFFI